MATCEQALQAGVGPIGEEFLALALLATGRRAELDALLSRVTAGRPADALDWDGYMALFLRGQEGRWSEVRRAIAAHPVDHVWGKGAYVEQLLGAGDREAAWAMAREAQAADEHGASYLAFHFAYAGDLVHAAELARHLPPDSPREATYRALLRWRGGDLPGAIEALRAVDAQGPMSADPAIPFPVFLLGEALAEAGRDGEAAAALRRFVATPLVYPAWSYSRGLFLLARTLDRMGEKAEARAVLARLLALWRGADPGQPHLQEARALAARLGLAAPAR